MWKGGVGGWGGGGGEVADADVLYYCNSLSSFFFLFPSAPGPPPIRMRKYFVWHLYR